MTPGLTSVKTGVNVLGMKELTPAFLLQSPELVTLVAPWCVRLDNLELGILLLVQPWLAVGGLRRAELERRIAGLASELPLGPVYFQRVKRTVARLEEIGAVRSLDERSQKFVATPQGFAAFILNLHVLSADPTLDGGELEMKRALVSRCNLILDWLAELPDEVLTPPDIEAFFDEVEQLSVYGQRVIAPQVITEALDILRLLASQREKIEERLRAARRQEIDLTHFTERGFPGAAALLGDTPGALGLIREMASGVLPRLGRQATVLRYEHFLRYLDELAALYAGELKTVALESVRGFLTRRRG
jgi:hypothetical protein